MFRETQIYEITLNVTIPNIPIKSQRFSMWVRLQNLLNTAYKRQPLNIQIQKDWKSKDGKNIQCKHQPNESWYSNFNFKKVNFKASITEKGHFLLIF